MPANVPDADGVRPGDADGVDLPRIEAAEREILLAIGEDPTRDGLIDTPARVARAYAEQFAGLLWRDLMVSLLLGVAERPGPREIAERAREAAAAFLRLHAPIK
mgnify:CR=1 FL=1